jgi:hypothetical protein
VPDFPFPLDGMVGRPPGLTISAPAAATPPTANDLQTRVFISGAGASDPNAMGLDEDVRMLVDAFVLRARSGAGQASAAAPASHGHGGVRIALHGLNLTADQQNELRRLILELVAKRAAGDGAAP